MCKFYSITGFVIDPDDGWWKFGKQMFTLDESNLKNIDVGQKGAFNLYSYWWAHQGVTLLKRDTAPLLLD